MTSIRQFLKRHPAWVAAVLAILPLLLLFLVDLAAGGALPGIASLVEEPVRARLAELILTFFTQTVIAVVLLVAWHRVVMLDQRESAAMVGLGVGRREIRYLGFWVLLSAVFAAALVLTYLAVLAGGFAVLVVAKLGFVIAGAVELPPLGRAGQFTLLSVAGFLCGMMVAVYVSVRLSLVLPAIATDQGRPLIEAWRLSRNNGWRLAAASILVLFVLPWLDTSKVRSCRYRPIYRWFFWILVADCIVLGVVGAKSPDDPVLGFEMFKYVHLGMLGTAYYFFHFLILLPLLGKIETPKPLPDSIGKSVTGGGGGGAIGATAAKGEKA